MIKEAYVSYEVAKLLCEKGFDWECETSYYISNKGCENAVFVGDFTKVRPWREALIAAPTHQMAMKWLRKKYNICIIIYPDIENGYEAVLYDIENNVEIVLQSFGVYGIHIYKEIYEEAVEAALKYCLENLI